jgi:hypothetical protein
MLNRRKVLLSLFNQSERPITTKRVNLLLALLALTEEKPSFQFIPTVKGPHSIDLVHDLRAFEKVGEVTMQGDSITIVEERTDPLSYALDEVEQELLLETLATHGSKSETALLDEILAARPFYGIRTERSDGRIEAIRREIRSAPSGLYTLGYEGLSIDGFINHLIANNVTAVVDVREFAFSRRSEFAKTNLEEALGVGQITYIGMPEVGIPTKARKEILEHKSKEELLEYYEEEILPTTASYATKVAELVKTGNIALICHEEDPGECHRSHFSAFALANEPSIGAVHDIRTKDVEERGWW